MGQKQLFCLSRAILLNSKILILDEATANVDLETDNLVQKKLRENFKESTVLVIAHRLATVIDSDRVLVMSQGQGVEFDHPFRLLVTKDEDQEISNQKGYFAQMVTASGKETA